ncbi:MAG: hypothetical protein ACRDH6_06740 [Actinomycetota bacterium]
MVETVFFDWALSFGVGLLFGIFGRPEFDRARSRLTTRAFALGFAFETVAVLPIALSVYVLAPDWMWMYWVDSARLSVGVEVFAFAMYYVSFVAGFLLAPELERLRARLAWIVWGMGSIGLLTAVVLTKDRLLALGTVSEFEAGTTASFTGSPFWVTLAGLVGAGVFLVLALGALRAQRAADLTGG